MNKKECRRTRPDGADRGPIADGDTAGEKIPPHERHAITGLGRKSVLAARRAGDSEAASRGGSAILRTNRVTVAVFQIRDPGPRHNDAVVFQATVSCPALPPNTAFVAIELLEEERLVAGVACRALVPRNLAWGGRIAARGSRLEEGKHRKSDRKRQHSASYSVGKHLTPHGVVVIANFRTLLRVFHVLSEILVFLR